MNEARPRPIAIADLTRQLAERDAEIERLNNELDNVDGLRHQRVSTLAKERGDNELLRAEIERLRRVIALAKWDSGLSTLALEMLTPEDRRRVAELICLMRGGGA